jgi:hypothetical protein
MASDRIISYADPAVGAVFFNITPQKGGRLLNELLKAARGRDTSDEATLLYPQLVAGYLDSFHRPLVFHEWCHILQALAYPGLFLRCYREMNLTDAVLAHYREQAGESLPSRLELPDEWRGTWAIPVTPHTIEMTDTGARIRRLARDERRRPNDLTENDLLEDAACVFQYKVEIGAPGTGASYSQWLRERRRYTMTFKFLSRLLGQDCAFASLPALVREAFSTNRPLQAFATLVSFTVHEGPSLPLQLGPEAFFPLCRSILIRSGFPVRSPDAASPVTDDPPALMDSSTHADFVDKSVLHPLWLLARRVTTDETLAGRLDRMLSAPHEFIPRDATKRLPDDLRGLWPPLTVVRLLHPDIRFRDSLVIISESYKGECPFLSGASYSQYLHTCLGYRQLALAIALDPDGISDHNCGHRQCPVFSHLCRRWMKIPELAKDCEFPGFVTGVTTRRIKLDTTGVPILIREGKNNERTRD